MYRENCKIEPICDLIINLYPKLILTVPFFFYHFSWTDKNTLSLKGLEKPLHFFHYRFLPKFLSLSLALSSGPLQLGSDCLRRAVSTPSSTLTVTFSSSESPGTSPAAFSLTEKRGWSFVPPSRSYFIKEKFMVFFLFCVRNKDVNMVIYRKCCLIEFMCAWN